MKRFSTAAAMVFALFLMAGPAAAQTTGFGAHAGVSIPTGGYGDAEADNELGGNAELGFSGGLDLFYPLAMVSPALSWYSSVDAIAHSVDEDAAGELREDGYFYVPVMTGLRFDVPIGPVGAFATGQLGVVLAQGPNFADPGAGDALGESEMTTNFGWNVGGGVQLGQNFYLGAKYYPLGDMEFEYENGNDTRDVSFVDIYLGFGVR